MSEQEEPRWDLLPYNAEKFFGLSDEYDLRDLKRSYNQLIRRFKPEKFPQEFQRIRAAFESLSDALRFDLPAGGMPPPSASPPVPPVESPQPAGETAATSRPSPIRKVQPQPAEPLPPTTVEALGTTPPREVYAELRDKPVKSADDFVALAFLADVVGAKTKSGLPAFIEWLLAGMAKFPHDRGLMQLVREYLRGITSLTELGALLRKSVTAIPPERFQYVTERAWDRLLREGTFEDFAECVRYCGQRLGKARGYWQVLFYIHVLPAAIWKADDEFVSELRSAVDDHFHSLESWTQRECETLFMLLDYREQREAILARGPACRRIDEAIRDWCLLSETQADLSVLDCLYFISQRGQRLLEEFPDPKESLPSFLLLWDEIASDVLERQEEPPPPEPTDVARHARDFMIRVHRRNSRTGAYFRGLGLIVADMALVFVTVITSGALLVRLFWRIFGEGRVWAGLLDGVLAVLLFVAGAVAALVLIYISRKLVRLRYETTRGELLKLLRVAPLPVYELAAAIEAREDEKYGQDRDSKIDDTAFIARGLIVDPAMTLFSLAQVCMHAAAAPPAVDADEVEAVEVVLAEEIA